MHCFVCGKFSTPSYPAHSVFPPFRLSAFLLAQYAGVSASEAAVKLEGEGGGGGRGATPIADLVSLSRRLNVYSKATQLAFNSNLLLVLGAYLLTMTSSLTMLMHPVVCPKFLLSLLCVAGLIAFNGVFGTSMSSLGRFPSVLSVTTVCVVVLVCINASVTNHMAQEDGSQSDVVTSKHHYGYEIPSALAGVSFCVGSTKLFLNVRAELEDRRADKQVLGVGLLVSLCLQTVRPSDDTLATATATSLLPLFLVLTSPPSSSRDFPPLPSFISCFTPS